MGNNPSISSEHKTEDVDGKESKDEKSPLKTIKTIKTFAPSQSICFGDAVVNGKLEIKNEKFIAIKFDDATVEFDNVYLPKYENKYEDDFGRPEKQVYLTYIRSPGLWLPSGVKFTHRYTLGYVQNPLDEKEIVFPLEKRIGSVYVLATVKSITFKQGLSSMLDKPSVIILEILRPFFTYSSESRLISSVINDALEKLSPLPTDGVIESGTRRFSVHDIATLLPCDVVERGANVLFLSGRYW